MNGGARGLGPAATFGAAALLLAAILPLAAQQPPGPPVQRSFAGSAGVPPAVGQGSGPPGHSAARPTLPSSGGAAVGRALPLASSGSPLAVTAQQPAPPTPSPLQAFRPRTRSIWLAAMAGAAAGAALGVEGLNFSAYPASVQSTRRWRAGISFGLIGAGLGAGLEAALHPSPGAPPARRFWLGGWQTPLLAGMLAAQMLDFTSTRYFRERGMPEWLLTDRLVDNRAAFIATEAAALAAAVGVAYVLYRTGHPRWARWFEGGYLTIGAVSAIANYRYPATGHDLF